MDCPNWPPPLPSLPLYPPCIKKPKQKEPPPVEPKNSSTQEWWDEFLRQTLKKASGVETVRRSSLYELTSNQRRELLPLKIPTKQEKLIWSIPLPEGSYPPNGLPIWERLYLDHPLPMLKAPPNALVFARQKIGRKLWKSTNEQEFILYDPQGYEVKFSYENVHDPHLTNYYEGSEIRGFLLSMGDANADGWGICTLKRFNEYRNYLRRVHLSLVHKEMEYQDMLQDELHKIKMYRQITKDTMEQVERKAMIDEIGAAIREAMRQFRENRIKRILKNIRNKERRVRRLYRRRAKEQEQRIKIGQKLQAEQELKKRISNEINRRKKIATLRKWHEGDEKRRKLMKKMKDEKTRQKAEKVRLKWQNKIDNLRKMYIHQDEYLELQAEIKKQNIELRDDYMEKIKKRQIEQFQELRKSSLRKKAMQRRKREDRKMSDAIMTTWLDSQESEYDLETEIYRVKKSLNSTMAELLSQDMEGPDRFSIIAATRSRIQREQTIPIQVSFAIEIILETTIQMWAIKRLHCLVETVMMELNEHGTRKLEEIKIRSKDIGIIEPYGNYKCSEPRGKIYKLDEEIEQKRSTSKKDESTNSSRTTFEETEIKKDGELSKCSDSKKGDTESTLDPVAQLTQGVIVNYVHFGPVETFEYPPEYDEDNEDDVKLKSIKDRPKTPMPSQKVLCEAGFSEERLKDVLPTVSDVAELREKGKFRKQFKAVALQLFKRIISITESAYEPSKRIRTINKLIFLGDLERNTVVQTLCYLIMNKTEKTMYETEEFDWITKVLAREIINGLLKPPEFQKIQNDGVARTKIMFYKPKHKTKKTN